MLWSGLVYCHTYIWDSGRFDISLWIFFLISYATVHGNRKIFGGEDCLIYGIVVTFYSLVFKSFLLQQVLFSDSFTCPIWRASTRSVMRPCSEGNMVNSFAVTITESINRPSCTCCSRSQVDSISWRNLYPFARANVQPWTWDSCGSRTVVTHWTREESRQGSDLRAGLPPTEATFLLMLPSSSSELHAILVTGFLVSFPNTKPPQSASPYRFTVMKEGDGSVQVSSSFVS